MKKEQLPEGILEAVSQIEARRVAARKKEEREERREERLDRAWRESLRPAAVRIVAWVDGVREAGLFDGVEDRLELLPSLAADRHGNLYVRFFAKFRSHVRKVRTVNQLLKHCAYSIEDIDKAIQRGDVWVHLRRQSKSRSA